MRNLLLIITALSIIACESQNQSEREAEEQVPPYEMTVETYEKSDPNCRDSICTEIKVVLPVLSGGDDSISAELNQEIQAQYRQMIKSRLPEPQATGSWDLLTDKFIEGYELFKMEFPDSPTAWYLYLEGDSSVILGDSVFTLYLQNSEFMGGAHANHGVHLKSYDLKNGSKIDLPEKFGIYLEELAEKKFREFHGLNPEEDMNEAGFIFPEGKFILPESMGYTAKGLTLIYNPYEVAPYSTGSTVIHIPLEELDKAKPSA